MESEYSSERTNTHADNLFSDFNPSQNIDNDSDDRDGGSNRSLKKLNACLDSTRQEI